MTAQVTIESADHITGWPSPEKMVRIELPGMNPFPLINQIMSEEKPEGVGYIYDGEDDGWANFDLRGEDFYPCGLSADEKGNAIITFYLYPTKEGEERLDGTTEAQELSLDDLMGVAHVVKKIIKLMN